MLRSCFTLFCLLALAALPAGAEPTLVGFASLPADTFESADDPAAHRSGQFLAPDADTHERTVPFANQPIQGISSILAGDELDTLLALSDNGYGQKRNSADYILTVYRVKPNYNRGNGEPGGVEIRVAFRLRDPDRKVPWPIVADAATYPESQVPVPAAIRDGRLLTGADFDVESFVRLGDGTFWVGDEFGPFLLHVSADGKILEPPVGLPGEGMHSPDHPTKDPATAKILWSGGFEAIELTIDWTGVTPLLLILEKRLEGERQVRVATLETKLAQMSLGNITYPLPTAATAVGGCRMVVSNDRDGKSYISGMLVLERDDGEGDAANHKALTMSYILSRADKPELPRRLIADLLNLADPDDLNGDGETRFRFPFLTIESVLPVDDRTVLVVNDNNYPLTSGRTAGEPDPTEFLLIRFDQPLAELGEESE